MCEGAGVEVANGVGTDEFYEHAHLFSDCCLGSQPLDVRRVLAVS